ncbi:MAG: ATP synthase F1 subunit delta [Bacteroidota bacterium]
MVEDRIGYRYAKSAFSIAEERKELDAVREDMLSIQQTINESRELAGFLQSPLIAASKKQSILDSIFGKVLKTELAKNLLQIIVQKGREMYLPQVANSFLSLYDEANKIQRGVLTSATELSPNMVAEIKSIMEKRTGQTFEIEQAVDPELIGGFTFKVGDSMFDGSIASSLNKMKQAFRK